MSTTTSRPGRPRIEASDGDALEGTEQIRAFLDISITTLYKLLRTDRMFAKLIGTRENGVRFASRRDLRGWRRGA